MSLNPLNELKRRLNDTEVLLPKRLCLAKNVIQSHHFPSAPKERVIADWLQDLNENKILKEEELKSILNWLNLCEGLGSELKIKLIQIVSQYLQTNPIQDNEVPILISFIENDKIKLQLNSLVDEYLAITITLLQYIKNNKNISPERIFSNIIRYYKESKRKLEFIVKLLSGENIETIFSHLHSEYHDMVINVCQNILFPLNKRTYFISFLQTLIRKDNLEELIIEKGDNIQSVLKIMDALFTFPKGRTNVSVDFIKHFIEVFVSCFRIESQIIFAFYIMVANFLNLQQNYITPAMNLPKVEFGIEKTEKCQRVLFLNMLQILLANEVDVSVRLTDTFGEKIPKVEIKKTFNLFLQEVMMNQLKLDCKPDKTTLEIIKTALKLDPTLIEQKMIEILPPLMTAKKGSPKTFETYTDMLNCLLETFFKLSRGIMFINQILPNVKLSLESCNTEQFELRKVLSENEANDKIQNKIITGNDIFPGECVEVYGKLTSELMFRQNKELLVSLQKDFEVNCLMMLNEELVSPSVIVLTEVLCAILSSFLCNSKMAEHTVPLPIAEDFWNVFQIFEEQCVGIFGECILKLKYNPPLITSFLKLCLSVAQMKLLNLKYSNVKIHVEFIDTSEVYDLSSMLPCLNREQWMNFAANLKEEENVVLLDNMILIKKTITELLSLKNIDTNSDLDMTTVNTYFVKRIAANAEILDNNFITKILFNIRDGKQCKELAKMLVKLHMNNPELNIFKSDILKNNRILQNYLTLEGAKNISKCFDNCDLLTRKLNKIDFKISEFAKENNMTELFENLSIKTEIPDETIKNYIDILTELQIPYLEKTYQLVGVFLLLAIKKCCQNKKIKKNANKILQRIYEVSSLPPNLYQIFPSDYIFEFENRTILNLVTLKKTNNDLLIVKSLLETAVKRVKIESNLVTSVVEILLKKKVKNNEIDMFNDPVFQISCTILPLIVKQKKLITASVHRSVLADLQDKLQKELLESFKNIDFTQIGTSETNTGNIDESLVDLNNIATLNAMAAYSLTLSRYCESTDVEEIKNLECLWSGLEFFVNGAIFSLNNPASKQQHIKSSVQLLNTTLRYIKKLESHEVFKQKDLTFSNIWQCLYTRLILIYEENGRCVNSVLDDIAVALKFLFESSSVECFCNRIIEDIAALNVLNKPNDILKDGTNSDVIKHKVAKFLSTQCLKANIIGPKCVAMSKLTYKTCRNLIFWIRQHYDEDSVANKKKRKFNIYSEDGHKCEKQMIKVDDTVCQLMKTNLEIFTEVILAAKKISLDYKYLDSLFELQHMIDHVMGSDSARVKCELSSKSYFQLFEGRVAVLNGLIVSREEMLEDRWPCFMQCYRALVSSLCERSNSQIEMDRDTEEMFAEIAHSIEKLAQSISKRKKHVSRISAYTVADMCALVEKTPPIRNVRQHIENSISLLIQACDSSYAMPFLKRALAGSAGQVTVANMYLSYKRYHKYVGNA